MSKLYAYTRILGEDLYYFNGQSNNIYTQDLHKATLRDKPDPKAFPKWFRDMISFDQWTLTEVEYPPR